MSNYPAGVTTSDLPGWYDDDDIEQQNARQEQLEEQARLLWQDNDTVAAWLSDYERDPFCREFAGIVRALCDGKPEQARAAAERIRRDFLLDYTERKS